VREARVSTRIYQASTSEMFGNSPPPQNEQTPFHPRSPYGVAKAFAHWATVNYREAYGLFACCGIMFNHESPRRDERFVTRKITRAAAMIRAGRQKTLYLGNLDSQRDWGYAPEYVEAMWRMLNRDQPDDFVLATGESHTPRQCAELAFGIAGFGLRWEGRGTREKGIDAKSGRVLIEVDPRYLRPAEVDHLRGDAGKAKRLLRWQPKVRFEDLIRILTEADIKSVEGSTTR
jgi:GDPmannose 4,6-dehydratase